MRYVCPDCSLNLNSMPAYHLHLAESHAKYEDGEYIQGKTERQLEKVGARTLKLLMDYKQCRSPKDWPLWAKYLQYYSRTHILIYDEKHQGWMINREDGILKADDLKELFAELGTASRRRREYQRADRQLYHNEDAIMLNHVHICILPKEKDILHAMEKEKVMREHYSGQYRMDDQWG